VLIQATYWTRVRIPPTPQEHSVQAWCNDLRWLRAPVATKELIPGNSIGGSIPPREQTKIGETVCRFFSLVQVYRNGGIDTYYSETVDSHSAICAERGLTELSALGDAKMVKIELVPNDKSQYLDVNQYKFVIDENSVPSWCNDLRGAMERQAYNALRDVLANYMSIERCVALNIPYHGSQTTVGGDLDCSNYAYPLPALTSVGGYLDCRNYAHPFTALTSVGGYLDCRDYAHPFTALTSVGEYLYCRNYAHLFPALTSVGGDLYCSDYAHPFPVLTSVGGDLNCSGYAYPFPALTSVGGYLDCRDYAHPFPVLTSVGAGLYCSNYAYPFPALTSVGAGLYCSNYAHPFPALTSVGGDLNCNGYAHLFPVLTSVGGNLYCSGYAYPFPQKDG